MSDLPPGLKEFGEQLERAAEREIAQRPNRKRGSSAERNRWRSFGIPAVAALAAAAVSAGAAGVVTRSGEPITPEPGDGAARDPSVIENSAANNPGGGPAWVLRAYTDDRGRECIRLGRLQNHVFGEVQRGSFHAIPRSTQGACAPSPGQRPLFAVERRTAIGLTIVFGLADDPAPVTVRVGHQAQTTTPAALGAFVSVFSDAHADAPVAVSSRIAGRVEVHRLRG